MFALHKIFFKNVFRNNSRENKKKCLWSSATDKIINEEVIAISTELYYECRLKRVKIFYQLIWCTPVSSLQRKRFLFQVTQKKRNSATHLKAYLWLLRIVRDHKQWRSFWITMLRTKKLKTIGGLCWIWPLWPRKKTNSLSSCSALDVVIIFMPNTVACSCFLSKDIGFWMRQFFFLLFFFVNVCK